MMLNIVAQIIGTREDVDNVLTEINYHLDQMVGVQFTIGVGLDGPTASWDSSEYPRLQVFMAEVAAMLRRKLDIAAWVD
jgi:hypothetical protein